MLDVSVFTAQATVALSSTEPEYIALAGAAQEAV